MRKKITSTWCQALSLDWVAGKRASSSQLILQTNMKHGTLINAQPITQFRFHIISGERKPTCTSSSSSAVSALVSASESSPSASPASSSSSAWKNRIVQLVPETQVNIKCFSQKFVCIHRSQLDLPWIPEMIITQRLGKSCTIPETELMQ